MEKKKRFSIILMFLVLFCAAFLVAAYYIGDKNILTFLEESKKVAVKSFHILGLDGKEKNPRREKEKKILKDTTAEVAILRVDDETVYYPEFAFYMLSSKKEFEQYFGKAIWSMEKLGSSVQDLLKREIINEIIQLKIIVREAKKAGFQIEEKEKKEIASSVQEQFLSIDPVIAAKHYFDPALISEIYDENFLASKFFAHYSKENTGETREISMDEILKDDYKKWYQTSEVEIFEENIKKLEAFKNE